MRSTPTLAGALALAVLFSVVAPSAATPQVQPSYGRAKLSDNKCCDPATRHHPVNGCATGCLTPPVSCRTGGFVGLWTDGNCKNQQTLKCTEWKTGVFAPLYNCTKGPCVMPNGQSGERCLWTLAGDSVVLQNNVTFCSGNPCP